MVSFHRTGKLLSSHQSLNLEKNPNSLEDYRPISLLPVLSKILEKMLARGFWKWTIDKISKYQHAFIPRHGVHTSCHQLEETLRTNLKARKHSLVMSEDIEKAFDRVLYPYIMQELIEWSIPREILLFIKSFLINRRILVKVYGYISVTLPLDNGIPQGYTLFMPTQLRKHYPILKVSITYIGIYADNIFVVASGKQTEVQLALNSTDFKIDNWSKIRDAVIPTNKTEILHICRQKACNCNTVRIRNVEHNIQDQMKILGIIFTKNLLWNNHQ